MEDLVTKDFLEISDEEKKNLLNEITTEIESAFFSISKDKSIIAVTSTDSNINVRVVGNFLSITETITQVFFDIVLQLYELSPVAANALLDDVIEFKTNLCPGGAQVGKE